MRKTGSASLVLSLVVIFLEIFSLYAGAMPPPSGPNYFAYSPVVSPVLSDDPAVSRPVGIGAIARGGNTLTLQVGTASFDSPVDVYFIMYAPFYAAPLAYSVSPAPYQYIDPLQSFFVLKPDYTFQSMVQGFIPWKKNVTVVNEDIFGNVPTFLLGQSTYFVYLLITPAGSLNGYYLWTTNFSTYSPQPVCDTKTGCAPAVY